MAEDTKEVCRDCRVLPGEDCVTLCEYHSVTLAAVIEPAKAALSALETPGDLTKDEIGYVIEDLLIALDPWLE